jgi:ribosomal protein L34E
MVNTEPMEIDENTDLQEARELRLIRRDGDIPKSMWVDRRSDNRVCYLMKRERTNNIDSCDERLSSVVEWRLFEGRPGTMRRKEMRRPHGSTICRKSMKNSMDVLLSEVAHEQPLRPQQ